jgi:hypothetical protein
VSSAATIERNKKPHQFKLKYAPHFGMFKNSAGDDLIDQINFMADRGFTAFEDNGMMNRDVAVQTSIGDALARRNMSMGVFVIQRVEIWPTHWLPENRSILIFFWMAAESRWKWPSV